MDADVLSARSALASDQSGGGVLTATSKLDLFVPAAVETSTVSASGNVNSSFAVMNDAANRLELSATGITSLEESVSAQLDNAADRVTAFGDHDLANTQSATGTIAAAAASTLYNDDRINTTGMGLVNSRLAITGNSTIMLTSNDASVAHNG